MLIDNENKNLKVHEWIAKWTEEGGLDIVTSYFTVGALAYLTNTTKERIEHYRFILGDIVNADEIKDRTLDLMNENITVEASLKLNKLAKEAVEFLKQENVESNICNDP